MAWNEPGGDNNDKDPWGRPRKNQGPPELDKMLKNLQKKLDQVMGGNGKGSDTGGDGEGPSPKAMSFSGIAIIIAILAIWILSGIYIVKPAQEAVVLRFGKYSKTVGEGPHWAPRFIDSVYKVDVQKIYSYTYTANMLTKDENIVTVTVSVQYRINNLNDFLFKVINPIVSLQEATASALRQVIGNSTLDEVLTSGREVVRQQTQVQLEKILAQYQAGIGVTNVSLQPAKAPEQVKEAFDDAIKAEQDRERFINQAQAYLEQKVARAVGQQKRLLADAQAYKGKVVLNSQGETARYLAVLPQFQQAPQVTRERIYIGAIQNVLSRTSKIFIDEQKGSNLILGLPLQQLLSQINSGNVTGAQPPLLPQNTSTTTSSSDTSKNYYSLHPSRFSERTGRGG